MAKRYRKRTIYAKIEVTKGTDPTPAGTDAVLTKNFVWNDPYAGERVSRDLDNAGLGVQEEINTNPNVNFSFDVELAGGGAAGTAVPYAALLRAVGFAETVNAGTSVEYDLVSDFTDSVTIYVVIDGDLQKVTGCVGGWGLVMERGIPAIRFNMTGNYATPVNDASPLTPDVSAYQVPVAVTKANTQFTLDGYSGVLLSLNVDSGIQILPRNVPNLQEVLQTDRGVTGTIVIQAPKVSEKDVFTDLLESHSGINTGALQVIHGTAAGNIATIDAPKVQLSSLSENNDNGIQTYTMNARFIPSASGDDEFKFTFT